MKKTFLAIAASAAVALAPMSTAMAETVSVKSDDAVATAWVPATQAELLAARGGINTYYGLSYTTVNALRTVGCFVTTNIPRYSSYRNTFCYSDG